MLTNVSQVIYIQSEKNTIYSIYLKLTCCLMSSHRLMPHSCLQLLWHQYIAVTAGPTAWQCYLQILRQLCHHCQHIQPWYVQSDPSVVLLSGQYYSLRSWYFHLLEKGNYTRVAIMSGFLLAKNETENSFLTQYCTQYWEYGLGCVWDFEVTCIVYGSVVHHCLNCPTH